MWFRKEVYILTINFYHKFFRREVSLEDAFIFAEKYGIEKIIETSAKTGLNTNNVKSK